MTQQPDGAPTTLVPELEEYRSQFEEIKDDALQLLRGLSEPQLCWRPAPRSWSVAECVQHLNLTAECYLPMIDDAIERGRRRGWFGEGPFRHGFLGNWFVRFLEPPPKMRAWAPRKFRPVEGAVPGELFPRFFRNQDELIARVEKANGLDLSRIRLSSPATRFFRLSLGQAFAVTTGHERRHLWQARRIRADSRYPAASTAGG